MKCPYCGFEMDSSYADWVDIGVGNQQCGPYECPCGAVQVSHDCSQADEHERRVGFYRPVTKEDLQPEPSAPQSGTRDGGSAPSSARAPDGS